MEELKKAINWKVFWFLFFLGILGVICVMPFIFSVSPGELQKSNMSPLTVALISIIQNGVLLAIFIFCGLYFSKQVCFTLPVIEGVVEKKDVKETIKSILGPSLIAGIITGIVIIGLDFLFSFIIESPVAFKYPKSILSGFLATFYGGFTEEIIMRLFLMTFITWILMKIFKITKEALTPQFIWTAIIVSSVIFGLGHLPLTAKFVLLDYVIILRGLLLNGIAGIVFGWFYWKKGLESAMIAHWACDFLMYVIFPVIYM